jgi:hypothetical protein
MKSLVLFNFKRLSQTALAAFAHDVIGLMLADAQFNDLKPQVEDLKARYDAYQSAAVAAVNGGRLAILERDEAYENLLKQLTTVARFVEIIADDRESVVLAAGFNVRKSSRSIDSVAPPTGLVVENLQRSGALRLYWQGATGAVNYAIEHLAKGEPAWKNGKYTTRQEVVLENYQPGTFVEFRIRSLGRKELESDWCSPVGIWVS